VTDSPISSQSFLNGIVSTSSTPVNYKCLAQSERPLRPQFLSGLFADDNDPRRFTMKRQWLAAVGLLAAGAVVGWSAARSQAPPGEKVAPDRGPAPREVTERATPLDTLDWMVGDWVDDDDQVTAEFSCHFTKNDAFLVRSFRIITKDDVRISGMQVIAWDPARETIRSWTYDSNGGFGEETWTQSGNRYTIRASYTLPDGGRASAINVMTYINDDKCTWKSVNREIDGAFQPDIDEVVLVRKPDADAAKGGN